MLALRKLAGENVEVSDEDLQRAYIRDYGEKVQARMIMLDNKRRADEVWEKANANPESFGELARKFSIEANSRSLDGAIPPIKRYGSTEESALEEAAFKLKEKGEISGIIQIGVGQQYVILQYEGRTKRIVEFEEVKESLTEQIKEEKTQVAVANIFTKLKENAKVQNFVTNQVSGGGVKKASATTTGAQERVTPAAATRTRPATSQQQPQQRPRQAQRQPKDEN
jgi:foldase protein PrsA